MKIPANILIVGGGTAGWMAANLLAHQLAKWRIKITLIESSAIQTVGVGEGSTPYLKDFFDTMGIAESEWMPKCHATYKCGIRFPDWSSVPHQRSYFHPFYSDLDGPFAQPFFASCSSKRHGKSQPTNPDHYFFTSVLSEQKKAPKSELRNDQLNYGYHFDAALLGRFLKDNAIKLGVKHLDDVVEKVHLDRQGNIAILATRATGPLRGDLFVDCSGFKGLLIQQTLGVTLVSYQDHLPCDRAVALSTDACETSVKPETVSQALSSGWMWNIPLMNRHGNGYVYGSKYLSQQAAEAELKQALGIPGDKPGALHLRWVPGRIAQHWKKNCVAVGLSQGFLEPLEAPMLYIIQRTIEGFIEHFVNGGFSDKFKEQFNQELNDIIDGTRDYLQAHYKLNSRKDGRFWIDCRENTCLSKPLADILAAWAAPGNFDQVLAEHQHKLAYLKTSWYCLLAGHGYFPTNSHAVVEQFPPKSIKQALNKLSASYMDHKTYLQTLYQQ